MPEQTTTIGSQQQQENQPSQVSLVARWDELSAKRDAPLRRARECASLTIPALLPPEGSTEADSLGHPYHSIGARAVNNISAKILLTLFPPNISSFKLNVDEKVLQEITELTKAAEKMAQESGDEEVGKREESIRLAITKKLKSHERIMRQIIEIMAARPKLFLALKYLVTCGNALLYTPDKKTIKVFKLNAYCVQRDADGNVLEILVREKIAYSALNEKLQQALTTTNKSLDQSAQAYKATDELEMFTQVKRLNEDTWEVIQEVDGVPIEEARGEYKDGDKGKPNPWLVLRWSAISDEDYGRGLVEEYLGDLRSINGSRKALNDYSSVAAKIIPLIDPSAPANLARKISNAKAGEAIRANKDHISFLELNKFYDFKILSDNMGSTLQSLEQGFMLNSSVQRQGERVTAEEIRTVASDLEDHLGGVYSVLAQELQAPFIRLIMYYSKEDLPDSLKNIHPEVTTGLDALGRGQDLTKLVSFFRALNLFPDGAGWKLINPLEGINRLASGTGVEPDNLIKTLQSLTNENKAEAQADQNATIQEGMTNAMPQILKTAGENPEVQKRISQAVQEQQ